MIQPDLSLPFAERHDDKVWDCLASLLHVPAQLPHARTTALMPLSTGWLGLGCAVRARHAAHYASWADSLPIVRQRHTDVADSIIMVSRVTQPCASGLSGIVRGTSVQWGSSPDLGRTSLREHDLGILPKMSRSCRRGVGRRRQPPKLSNSTSIPPCGQPSQSRSEHCGFLTRNLGIHCFPRFDPQPFRVLMSRRLRLPMPLSSRSCRCGRLPDSLGHHCAGGVGEAWVCS